MNSKLTNVIDYLFIFLICFAPAAFGTVQPWSKTILFLAITLCLLLYLINVFQQNQITYTPSFLYLPLILFLIYILVQLLPLPRNILKNISPQSYEYYSFTTPALFFSPTYNFASTFPLSLNAFATTSELTLVFVYFITFCLIINYVRSPYQFNLFINTMVFIGFTLSLLGILQKYGGNGKLYWIQPLTQGGLPFASYVNRDHFAGFINVIIFWTLGYFVGLHRSSKRLLLGFIIVIMATALILSLSRAGTLSFFASLVLFSLFLLARGSGSVKKRLGFVILVLVSILLFIFWLDWAPVITRLRTVVHNEDLTYPRIPVWLIGWQMVKDFFPLGIGLGNFATVYPIYRTEEIFKAEEGAIFTFLHNDYEQLFLETGIIGTFLILVFLGLYCWIILRRIFVIQSMSILGLTIGGFTACISMLLHSIVDFNLHIPANGFIFYLSLGLTYCIAHTVRIKPMTPPLFSKSNTTTPHPNSDLNLRLSGKDELYEILVEVRTIVFSPLLGRIMIGFISFLLLLFVIIPTVKKYVAHRYYFSSREIKRYAQRIPVLENAVKYSPDNIEYRYFLALAWEHQAAEQGVTEGDRRLYLKRCENELVGIINKAPTVAKYWGSLAWLQYILGNYEEAETCFQRALSLDRFDIYVHQSYRQFRLQVKKLYD